MTANKFNKQFLESLDHLQNRAAFNLKVNFPKGNWQSLVKGQDSIFLLAPSDVGVIRNGGRRGASFGPLALMNLLKKCTPPYPQKNSPEKAVEVHAIEVSDQNQEADHFSLAQQFEQNIISEILNYTHLSGPHLAPYFHLGGGHDHVFPMAQALLSHPEIKKLTIINLDPHLDTRQDPRPHSGTPFRDIAQLAQKTKKQTQVIQWGTGLFCNPEGNWKDLPNNFFNMQLCTLKADQLFSAPFLSDSDTGHFFMLSLDSDVIHSWAMEAVSAPSISGVSPLEIKKICNHYQQRQLKVGQRPLFGIYEYNPIYDNLSMKGARVLVDIIFQSLFLQFY